MWLRAEPMAPLVRSLSRGRDPAGLLADLFLLEAVDAIDHINVPIDQCVFVDRVKGSLLRVFA